MDTTRNRTKRTGQYTYTGGFDRLCRCGHTLGVHTADRAKIDGVTHQPCGNCECQCFKPTKECK